MKNKISARTLATVAILGAVSTVLMYLEFPLPFLIPPFIRFDFADIPALLASFAMGPVAGISVCLIRCTVHLLASQSAGVGELANFLLGCFFVLPAGLVYGKIKTRGGALIGAACGAVLMTAASLPVNLFITYPFYISAYGMTEEAILSAYRAIIPSTKNLVSALIIFNMPFTFLKGAATTLVTFLIYKRLSPILHSKDRQK